MMVQSGIKVTPTNMPGNVSSWSYAQIGGSLPIAAAQMPQVGGGRRQRQLPFGCHSLLPPLCCKTPSMPFPVLAK